ncbi:N-acetyl-anhydromuranmyl-L-alanine amidase [Chromatiales bacterium (ex Bugula neritina AB1)]|nr:N-acetyl-anhydromuranmyl-L-alanine amidase [Chromatiales bacterium (ex Bugula neritina AB1)]
MTRTIKNHWLAGSRICLSPNWDERPSSVIDTVVVHNISLPPGQFGECHIEELFCNSLDPLAHPYFEEIHHLRVSAHLLINREGECCQFVGFDKRAWHAGQSSFQGRENFNDFSIGIELEGSDHVAYTAEQYLQLAEVIILLKRAYPQIADGNIVGHDQIAPGRKTDPGPAFDWLRLRGLLTVVAETV